MKKINTSTYYLFNISILLDQYLHIQKQVIEHLQDLNELYKVDVNINNKELEFIHKCNSNINDIFSYKNEIIPNVIEDITKQVKSNCNHEWVNDDIDLHLDQTMHIYYCNYCGLTKNI
jgi:hypothetical protein